MPLGIIPRKRIIALGKTLAAKIVLILTPTDTLVQMPGSLHPCQDQFYLHFYSFYTSPPTHRNAALICISLKVSLNIENAY